MTGTGVISEKLPLPFYYDQLNTEFNYARYALHVHSFLFFSFVTCKNSVSLWSRIDYIAIACTGKDR